MLAGQPPERWPSQMDVALDERALNGEAPFDRAALLSARNQLRRIEQLTGALVDRVAQIGGFRPMTRNEPAGAPTIPPATSLWALDPDRVACVLRTFVSIWIVLLACLYVPGFPMPSGAIPVAAAVSIMLALMPQVRVQSLILPVLGSVAIGGAFHVFVMPHLSSFLGLGLGIFIAVFLIGFLLAKPELDVARTLGLSLFVMLISVENQQSYDFLFVVNFALMWQLALFAAWTSSWFPISFQPQRVIFKQLHRFQRSCDWLAAMPQGEGPLGEGPLGNRAGPMRWLHRRQLAFHTQEVASLPAKIGRWIAALPNGVQEERAQGEKAQALATGLQSLSDRLRELVEVRGAPQSAALLRDLLPEIKSWQRGIQDTLRGFATDPAGVPWPDLGARLETNLAALEARIAESLDAAPQESLSPQERENLYRLLGAYRGLSHALIEVVKAAGEIDWPRLRQLRF